MPFKKFFKKIFGEISWVSPSWLQKLKNNFLNNLRKYLTALLALIILISISFAAYYWYQKFPKPILITANITAPDITPDADPLKPKSLVIDFIKNLPNGAQSASVAPLANIGLTITSGVTLSPNIAGTWKWNTDNELVFKPNVDWPAQTDYQISFDKSLFIKDAKLQQYQYEFSTNNFEAKIDKLSFYVDLKDPKVKQVIATLKFNFPVDEQSVKDHVRLVWQEMVNKELNINAQQIPTTITFSKNDRQAYITSQAINLPEQQRYVELILDKGIKAQNSQAKISEMKHRPVLIPDVGSFFKVSNATSSIVRDKNDKPQQVLVLETTVGIENNDFLKNIHVYQLPKDLPAHGIFPEKKDYQWQEPGEITVDILAKATPVKLKEIPPDHDYPTLHSFIINVSAPSYLYVKVDKGLKSLGDFILSNDYQAIVSAANYPQEINFLHKGSIISLSSDKKLSVLIRGIPHVKFTLARVLPDAVNHLVTQTTGQFTNPQFQNPYDFNQQNISVISSEIRDFNIKAPSDIQYSALDFEKYLPKENHLGLFLLTADGWDPQTQNTTGITNSRLILITDMGLLVKNNQDNTHDIFVQSIGEGTAVSDAIVKILGKNGVVIMQQTTDKDGHAHFPDLTHYTDAQTPTVYVVDKNNDVSFIPYQSSDRTLDYSKFDIDGVTFAPDMQNLSAFIFSDRGIYRPGENINFGIVVKKQYAGNLSASMPVEEVITDPRGNNVVDEKIMLPQTGFVTMHYQTQPSSPTGTYTANLYIVKDNQMGSLLGSQTVQVQEFLPDRLKMKINVLSKDVLQDVSNIGWLLPEDLKLQVSLWNLFGTPATQRTVTGKIILQPQTLSFSQYPDFIFSDPLFDAKKPAKTYTINLPETKTDAQGLAEFKPDLSKYANAIFKLNFNTDGFEADGGRGVSGETSFLVAPINYLIGYKPDTDLTYIKQNSASTVNFIAINSKLQQVPVNNLHLQLYEDNMVATLIKNADGTYQYQTVKQEKLINASDFSIAAIGSPYTLPANAIGDYTVKLLDDKNVLVSQFDYSIVGTSGKVIEKNAKLDVQLNQKHYAPGATIEMQISAPYAGSGLITIERDKVYAYKWFKTDGATSMQTIQIPADLQGNGYINIAYTRDFNSDEIYINPLSYAVIPFAISNQAQKLNINLNVPTLVKPGDNLAMTYSTDKPGQIIVYAVNEGILQVAKYQTPDPLTFFFQKQALNVTTEQILDLILPKFIESRELSAVGGDGVGMAAFALKANLNPFARRTEAPVAYWSGILTSNNTPQIVNYKVPDYFNGSLRVMAVAAGDNNVGSTDKSVTVRGDYVINPNVPNFVAPNDKFTVSVSVANNIKNSNAQTLIKLQTTPQIKILGSDTQNIMIPSGQEKSVEFNLQANADFGSAELTFTASQNNIAISRKTDISVRPAAAYQSNITMGYSKKASNEIPITLKLYPNLRIQKAYASSNPLIVMNGTLSYLKHYPYDCTEQLISKAFAELVMAKQPLFAEDKQTIQNKIDDVVTMLRSRLNSSGGFSYWPGLSDNYYSSFSTLYAMDYLTEAKAEGYNIPQDLLNSGLDYLKNYAGQSVSNMQQARLQAYAIYLLTRNELVTSSYLTNLQLYLIQNYPNDWQKDITASYMAATYQLLQNDKEAEKLIAMYKLGQENTGDNTDFYNTAVSDAQYITLLARHFPTRLQQLGINAVEPLIADMSNDTYFNSLSAGFSAVALNAYATAFPANNKDNLSITEVLANNTSKALTSTNPNFVDAYFDSDITKLIFNNPNGIDYFYQIEQTGFPISNATQAVTKGMEIYRDYFDAQGKQITSATLGDKITEKIRIRAQGKNTLSNVVIVDLLPGGFDVVPDSVQQSYCDYVDQREDRVVFYCSVYPSANSITYQLRAVNKGQYVIPPIFASAMYNPALQAQGVGGEFEIK